MLMSVLIPCYNEGKTILGSYQKLKTQLNSLGIWHEIIFCNDASTDNTGYLLEKIAIKDKKVKVINYYPNKGIGFAFRQMCKVASGDILIHMEADLAMDPKVTLPLFLKEIETADIVIGSRYAQIKPDFPLRRMIPSKIVLCLNKLLFSHGLKDTNSGFFALKKEILGRIKLYSNDFGIYIELVVKAKKCGFSLKEIPIKFTHNTEHGEISMLKHGPRILLDIARLWLNLKTDCNLTR